MYTKSAQIAPCKSAQTLILVTGPVGNIGLPAAPIPLRPPVYAQRRNSRNACSTCSREAPVNSKNISLARVYVRLL